MQRGRQMGKHRPLIAGFELGFLGGRHCGQAEESDHRKAEHLSSYGLHRYRSPYRYCGILLLKTGKAQFQQWRTEEVADRAILVEFFAFVNILGLQKCRILGCHGPLIQPSPEPGQ
jgi:hypothetical protein